MVWWDRNMELKVERAGASKNWGRKVTQVRSAKLCRHVYFYPVACKFVRNNLGLKKTQSSFL